MIGGKGSGKTQTGGGLLAYWVQAMPGCKLFMAAATYNQSAESSAVKLIMTCKMMGLNFKYREKMTIDNLPHQHVYHFPDFGSNICIRSADNMDMIEGSEWNGGVIEEVQLWKENDVNTAFARIRRDKIQLFRFLAGLPEDEEFWMYDWFRRNEFDYYELDTRENAHNLPADYIPGLRRMYPGAKGERYIEGKPVSLNTTPIFSYDKSLHSDKLARALKGYDPYRVIFLVFDFNVNPCCASVWQVKEVEQTTDKGETLLDRVVVQIDEYEDWGGGTRSICQSFIKDYEDHIFGIEIFGDATGNSEDTRNASVTDYTIIAAEFKGFPNVIIRQGLLINRSRRNRSRKARQNRFSNPPVKQSIQHANSLMIRSDGTTGVVFMLTSKFVSGGCSKSVRMLRYSPNGTIDEKNDRLEGREKTRTHFAATFRYMTWFMTGGKDGGKVVVPGRRGVGATEIGALRSGKTDKPVPFA
jgi:phage terminase large subunit-like protein